MLDLYFRYAFPQSNDPSRVMKWQALAYCLLGAMLGYLTHPLCWFIAGPVRWVCLIAMTASGESAFDPAAVGDGGKSIGILQFNAGNDSIPLDKRMDPFTSGYGAGVNVQAAIWRDWRWLPYLACPIIGPAWFRALWYGPSMMDSATTSEVWARFTRDDYPRAWHAWWTWRVLTFPVAVLVGGMLAPVTGFLATASILPRAVRGFFGRVRKGMPKWVQKWAR